MRLGALLVRAIVAVAIVFGVGLGGALLQGRGTFRQRWRQLRARVGVVALLLVIAGGVTFVLALVRQLRG